MIVVIIAGGSGTRLWPLSTPDYPKRLLEVNGDEALAVSSFFDTTEFDIEAGGSVVSFNNQALTNYIEIT